VEIDKSHDFEVFSIVTDHFKQDTREFWTRANFYLVAHAGLFSVFFIDYPGMIKAPSLLILVIPALGFTIAIFWFFVLRGAMTFLSRWRDQVIRLDRELDRFQCYVEVESTIKQNPLSSPSYLTQFLPLFFGVAWGLILIYIITFI